MIIDISNYQGNIDFKTVKTQIEGAIIRCGWGSDSTKQDDPKFNEYVKGCIDNNIPFGIYLYSYAKTIEQAESEAKHVMRLCDPIKNYIKFPVFLDLEENNAINGIVERAKRWAQIMTENGYTVGIYSSTYWWSHYLKDLSNFPNKWVANWGNNDGKPHTKPSNSNMILWQYTSVGRVAGINGNVDCNLYYGEAIGTEQKPEEKPKEENEGVYNMPMIKKGSKGKAVKIWQVIAGVTVDGLFGANTDKATREFQKAHGLTVDGIVGKNTWKAGLDSVK